MIGLIEDTINLIWELGIVFQVLLTHCLYSIYILMVNVIKQLLNAFSFIQWWFCSNCSFTVRAEHLTHLRFSHLSLHFGFQILQLCQSLIPSRLCEIWRLLIFVELFLNVKRLLNMLLYRSTHVLLGLDLSCRGGPVLDIPFNYCLSGFAC